LWSATKRIKTFPIERSGQVRGSWKRLVVRDASDCHIEIDVK